MNGAEMIEVLTGLVAFDVAAADRASLVDVMAASARLQAWKDAFDAGVARAVQATDPLAEQTVGDTHQIPHREAVRLLRRAELLERAPAFAVALGEGRISAAHVDTLVNALQRLEPKQRAAVLATADDLVAVAARVVPSTFRRELTRRIQRLVVVDAEALYEHQLRSITMRTWIDDITKMWCFHGELDPATGKALQMLLQGRVESLFGEKTPRFAPSDPVARHHHLTALALADLVTGGGATLRWESLAVIDVGAEVVDLDWGLPLEIPPSVRDRLLRDSTLECVIVSNGRVLYAPGKLDEGRDRRVASRAQRRALRGLYRCCAMPGCNVPFERARMHHVVWWQNGGRTDLDNLLPLCGRHHHAVHDLGWIVRLGPNRELTVIVSGGAVLTTGPPSRRSPAA